MTCGNAEDNTLQARQQMKHNHIHIPSLRDKGNATDVKAPTCIECSLDEGIMRGAIYHPRKRTKMHSRKLEYLSVFNDPTHLTLDPYGLRFSH